MARDEAYQRAEQKIQEALQSGATVLDLSERVSALHYTGLSELPASLSRLTRLQSLDLSNNHLTTLPESLGQLTELRWLSLANNHLTMLPVSIGRLTQLRSLDLFNNRLTTLPRSLGQLTLLRSLYLTGNQLIRPPKCLWRLTQLQTLNLSGNQLTTLPELLSLLTQLQELELSGNQLTKLPESLGRLSQLQSLHLSSNQLTTLPDSIGQLTQLQTLDLSWNQLTMLPDSLGQLAHLRALHLLSNQLMTLPDSLGGLTQLQTLDLSGNRLTSLPSTLRRLTKLDELFLHGNSSLALPDEVLGGISHAERLRTKPPAEIIDYYFRIAGLSGRPLGECKLIVVGRGGAGKTSLVKRLNGLHYDPQEPETHGITIQTLEFECTNGPVTGRVWDFGGQIVLHSMHEFFLTARSLYVLVLGERDDMLERDATYWLQLIRSYAGNVPVVVALNKSAGRQRHFDHATLEKNYGPILGWVATECSESDPVKGGIRALLENLIAAMDSPHMDSIRRKFPAKWFDIKNTLEQMEESYLDYHDYVKKCEAHGEHDPKEQAALAADLHDLGVALNYAHDPRLRDTSVLRPDWLASGIYAVLRANDVDAKHLPPPLNVPLAEDGVITADSLTCIHAKAEAWGMLKAADYPVEKRAFLLRLMELFHLSYPLDQGGKRQLVPTLLPPQPPDGADEPEGTNRVRLRYEFQVVPAPLIPWFIARTFSLIPNRLHWRRGAILTFGEARARVWTTQDERYVYATVAGPVDDRADLVTMIRETLVELFRDYRGLQVSEQWEHDGEWVPRKTLERFGKLTPSQEDIPFSLANDEASGLEGQS